MSTNNFSLSKHKEKVFPNSVIEARSTFFINADFRNILKILRMLADNSVLDRQKPFLLCKLFYTHEVPLEPILPFYRFLFAGNPAEEKDVEREQQFDFEFDAEEIYASFLLEYATDLFEVDFLHWYKFKIMLANLSVNSPLAKKVQLRFMDLKDYKGKDKMDLEQAKEAAQIPEKYTWEELREIREFERKWEVM